MSVLPMKRVFIAGMRKDRKQMLELLQRQGAVEISLGTPCDLKMTDDPVFKQIDMSGARATFEKNIVLAKQALDVLDKAVPGAKDGGLFGGRVKMSLTDYQTNTASRDQIMGIVYDLNSLSKSEAEIQAEIPKYTTQLETLQPWMQFELPLDFTGTRYTKAFIGSFPNEISLEEIYAGINEGAPDITGADVTIVSSSNEQTCVMVICHQNDADAVEAALRKMNFARPAIAGDVPAKQADEIKRKLASFQANTSEIEDKIKAYAPKRDKLKFIIDYFRNRSDKYDIISNLYQSKNVFFINGFIPEKSCKALDELLNARFDCIVEFSEPSEKDDVPVLLRNNWFAAPVEGVIEGYSLPSRFEIDPTFLASLFYYCLFGIMLSDAGYGLIMVIACGVILAKFSNTMEPGTKKFIKMLFGCGIGTLFWGLMFGSFFGDAVNKVATTFFGRPDIAFNPLWFSPSDKPIQMLGFAFIVGIAHIFTGLGALFYMDFKQHKIKDAIYDVIFWYMLLIGCIGLLLSTEMMRSMFNLTLVIPQSALTVFKIMILISAVGIILTGGRSSRNWGKRILKGLYSLYGISSYLSDVLSYSRLLALGLATSVISTVFNQMGTMAGGGVVGAIMFIVIFVLGHTLNLLINALGAYVHTNRLEYVEFFGKFYEGGGKPFEPFNEKTIYYNVQE